MNKIYAGHFLTVSGIPEVYPENQRNFFWLLCRIRTSWSLYGKY